MKQITFILLLVLATFSVAHAGEYRFVKSEDKTSDDIFLSFKVDKTKWEYGKVRIWRRVENTGSRKYDYVKITFTAKSQGGEFIERNFTFFDPRSIAPDQVGYITDFGLDCDGVEPYAIEYKISGD